MWQLYIELAYIVVLSGFMWLVYLYSWGLLPGTWIIAWLLRYRNCQGREQYRLVFVCNKIYLRTPCTAVCPSHYGDDTMDAIASQITSLTIVYSTVYSDANQRKRQSSASLAFVRGIHRRPVNSPHKWPITRKIIPFDDVIVRIYFVTDSVPLFTEEQDDFLISWSQGFLKYVMEIPVFTNGSLYIKIEPWRTIKSPPISNMM